MTTGETMLQRAERQLAELNVLRERVLTESGVDPEHYRWMKWMAGPDYGVHERNVLEQPDWQERLRAAVERRRADWARREAETVREVLKGGLNALRRMPADDLRALVHDDRIARWRDDCDGRCGGILAGPTGVGKTSACVAVVRRLIREAADAQHERLYREGHAADQPRRIPHGIHWCRALDLGQARAEHRLGAGEPKMVQDAVRAWLLVVDDVGWERDSSAFNEVVARRYDEGVQTVVTTGMRPNELVERYSEAVVRRILESGGRKGRIVDVHTPAR